MWLIRDSKYAVLGVLSDLISNLSAMGSIFLLAWQFDGVGGMDKFEVLFMLGYIMVINGLFTTFFGGNNGHISRIIGRGQLDHLFMQPLSLPVQLITCGFYPFTGGGLALLSGAGVLAVSATQLKIVVGVGWIAALTGFLAASMLILLSLSYMISSVAFYAPVAAEEISTYVIGLAMDLGKYPLSGMPKGIQLPLVFIFPAGLMAWFPALALMGKSPLDLPAVYPALAALVLMMLAQYIFRRGMNHYVKTGANRYVPYGYRN
jgi:ABC-2 type transport system permease protein